MEPVQSRPPRPPGQSALGEYPEIYFSKEWGNLVRRARNDRGLSQGELGDLIGVEQAMISYIETGKVNSSKAVVPLCEVLNIPRPKQYFDDELEERWVEVGRVLRRVNEAGLRGLLAAAEAMIVNAEPHDH